MDEDKGTIRLELLGNVLELRFVVGGQTGEEVPEWSPVEEGLPAPHEPGRGGLGWGAAYTWGDYRAEVTIRERAVTRGAGTEREPGESEETEETSEVAGIGGVLEIREPLEGINLVRVRLTRGGAEFELHEFKAVLRTPLVDVQRVWMPHMLLEGQLERVSLQWGFGYVTSATRSMPFVECLDRRGQNRASIGLLDQVTETLVRGCGFDQEARHVIEFSRPLKDITITTASYEEQIYLNTCKVPWTEALTDFTRAHDELHDVTPAPLHPDTTQPLYCTWYAHGPDVDEARILQELELVRGLGFKNYVIDEGWFGRPGEGWLYRGDYSPTPEKFSDFGQVIREIQNHGLNALLWVSPFQIGPKSSKYQELKSYLIRREKFSEFPSFLSVLSPWVQSTPNDTETEERWELCPRTGFTEKYVPELVAGLMKEYGLDGLKIDFLDQVSPQPRRADHEHIYQTHGEALWKTLQAMNAAIRKVKRDAIIEFRLPYANLLLRPLASLYRAQDCPWDFDQNRRLCGWINAFTPRPGPYSEADYISWRPDERPETVAKALASAILYCVPSIGRNFTKLPAIHVELVRRWLAFYLEHREEIRGGEWRPLEFDPHYSTFAIESGDATFVGMFKDVPGRVRLPGGRVRDRLYLFNSTWDDHVHTRVEPAAGRYELIVRDHLLQEAGGRRVEAASEGGLDLDIAVPEGGLVEARRVAGTP
ncbi:MAG: alpha-galactosidase [Firmicutes bacterium]|nr:alpha-galactosidase [Bacillota bacterium]